MWTRKELKTNAKAALKRNYWRAVLVAFLATALLGGTASSSSSSINSDEVQMQIENALRGLSGNMMIAVLLIVLSALGIGLIVSVLINVLLENPLQVGVKRFFARCRYEEKTSLGELLFGFENSYRNIVVNMVVRDIVIFLWTLLLIVPGMIKFYELSMVPYILADYPDMDGREARALSRKMMKGSKWKAFVLDLSFIGWMLLGGLTGGLLLVFYVAPYMQLTDAELYHALKAEHADEFPVEGYAGA